MHISCPGFQQTLHDKSQNFPATVINVCLHLDDAVLIFQPGISCFLPDSCIFVFIYTVHTAGGPVAFFFFRNDHCSQNPRALILAFSGSDSNLLNFK